MLKHRFKGLGTILGSQVDPEKTEELSKILKLIKNDDQSKREGSSNSKDASTESELVGLIEEFYTQYQSLYALYDRLTGENGKIVSRKIETGASSISSSSSDTDYFSSDEVDSNRRPLSEYEHHTNIKNNASSVSDTTTTKQLESETTSRCNCECRAQENDDETQASDRVKELEEQLNCQKKEVESLKQQKLDLQVLVKTKEDQVCSLEGKLEDNENQARSNITELMAEINTLTLETMSLRTQKAETESTRNESLTQMEGLREQLNVMHQNVDSLSDKNRELEAQVRGMRDEKEDFAARVKDLELELESRCNQQNELEQQLRDKSYEIKQLGEENKALKDRNDELKIEMAHTGEELSVLAKEHESSRSGASMQAKALAAQVKELRLELECLKEDKRIVEFQNEQREKEYSESIAKIFDQGKAIKQQAETIERMSGENEEVKLWYKKFRQNRQFTERRIEELAQETRRQLEDNIKILNQRLHVAEQLLNENKGSFKLAKERYERKKRILMEKIARYEEEEGRVVGIIAKLEIKPADVVNGLELAAGKIEEHRVYLMNRVSKMVEEVQMAKDWIKQRKGEMKQLKDNVDDLTALLDDKQEQEFLLREKVLNLEAKVSKEGGEKLNLMKSVSQLEKKVATLENSLKEKEEELVNLGEMKREAIRQLCFLNDYHRTRCDYLNDYISKNRTITRP